MKENFCQKHFLHKNRVLTKPWDGLNYLPPLPYKMVMFLMKFHSKKLRVIHFKFQSSFFLRTFVLKKDKTVDTETLLLH